MAAPDVITGFEGIQDTLLLQTIRQQQELKEQVARAELPGMQQGLSSIHAALLGLVDHIAPDMATQRAKAVDEARVVAQTTTPSIDGEQPLARRVRVVRAAAEELRRKGLYPEADRLDGNADQLAQQALEMRRLGGQAVSAESQGRVDLATEEARKEKPALDNQLTGAQLDRALTEADVAARTADANVAKAFSEAKHAGFQADQLDPVELRLKRNQAVDAAVQTNLHRVELEDKQSGKDVTITYPGAETPVTARRLPNGLVSLVGKDGTRMTLQPGLYTEVNVNGSMADTTLPKTAKQNALMAQLQLSNFVDLAQQLTEETLKNPGSRTLGGQAAAVAGRIKAEAQSLQLAVGMKSQTVEDEKMLHDFYTQYNVTDAKQQSLIAALAYAQARIREPSAPALSRSDIEGAAGSLGGKNPSDVAFREVLRTVVDTQFRNVSRESEMLGVALPPAVKAQYDKFMATGKSSTKTPAAPAQAPAGARRGARSGVVILPSTR